MGRWLLFLLVFLCSSAVVFACGEVGEAPCAAGCADDLQLCAGDARASLNGRCDYCCADANETCGVQVSGESCHGVADQTGFDPDCDGAVACGGHGEPSCDGSCDAGLQACVNTGDSAVDGRCYICCADAAGECPDACQGADSAAGYYDADCDLGKVGVLDADADETCGGHGQASCTGDCDTGLQACGDDLCWFCCGDGSENGVCGNWSDGRSCSADAAHTQYDADCVSDAGDDPGGSGDDDQGDGGDATCGGVDQPYCPFDVGNPQRFCDVGLQACNGKCAYCCAVSNDYCGYQADGSSCSDDSTSTTYDPDCVYEPLPVGAPIPICENNHDSLECDGAVLETLREDFDIILDYDNDYCWFRPGVSKRASGIVDTWFCVDEWLYPSGPWVMVQRGEVLEEKNPGQRITFLFTAEAKTIDLSHVGYLTKLKELVINRATDPLVVPSGYLSELQNLNELTTVSFANKVLIFGNVNDLVSFPLLEVLRTRCLDGFLQDIKNPNLFDIDITSSPHARCHLSGDFAQMQLPRLRRLGIYGSANQLTNIGSFSGLPQLTSFYLSDPGNLVDSRQTSFSGDLSQISNTNRALERFVLKGQEYRGDLTIGRLEGLPSLQYLELTGPISGTLDIDNSLLSLRQVIIKDTNIGGPISGVDSLPGLIWLKLINSPLEGTIDTINVQDRLIILDLSGTLLEGSFSELKNKFESLSNINLENTALTGSFNDFSSFSRLSVLKLANTGLTGVPWDLSLLSKTLTYLDISGTEFGGDAALFPFSNYPNLESFFMSNTDVYGSVGAAFGSAATGSNNPASYEAKLKKLDFREAYLDLSSFVCPRRTGGKEGSDCKLLPQRCDKAESDNSCPSGCSEGIDPDCGAINTPAQTCAWFGEPPGNLGCCYGDVDEGVCTCRDIGQTPKDGVCCPGLVIKDGKCEVDCGREGELPGRCGCCVHLEEQEGVCVQSCGGMNQKPCVGECDPGLRICTNNLPHSPSGDRCDSGCCRATGREGEHVPYREIRGYPWLDVKSNEINSMGVAACCDPGTCPDQTGKCQEIGTINGELLCFASAWIECNEHYLNKLQYSGGQAYRCQELDGVLTWNKINEIRCGGEYQPACSSGSACEDGLLYCVTTNSCHKDTCPSGRDASIDACEVCSPNMIDPKWMPFWMGSGDSFCCGDDAGEVAKTVMSSFWLQGHSEGSLSCCSPNTCVGLDGNCYSQGTLNNDQNAVCSLGLGFPHSFWNYCTKEMSVLENYNAFNEHGLLCEETPEGFKWVMQEYSAGDLDSSRELCGADKWLNWKDSFSTKVGKCCGDDPEEFLRIHTLKFANGETQQDGSIKACCASSNDCVDTYGDCVADGELLSILMCEAYAEKRICSDGAIYSCSINNLGEEREGHVCMKYFGEYYWKKPFTQS